MDKKYITFEEYKQILIDELNNSKNNIDNLDTLAVHAIEAHDDELFKSLFNDIEVQKNNYRDLIVKYMEVDRMSNELGDNQMISVDAIGADDEFGKPQPEM